MRAMPAHYIVDLSYPRDYLECSCGVTMKARPDIAGVYDWTEHRRATGQVLRSIGQSPRRMKGTWNVRTVV